MRELDLLEIRRKKQLFSWCIDPFSCDYHIELMPSSTLKIFAEYNISFEYQCLYLFELAGIENGFALEILKGDDEDVFFAGNRKESVIKFVVEKVIVETTLGVNWVQENFNGEEGVPDKKDELEKEIKKHLGQKEELRRILQKKLEEFIQ